MPRGKEITPQGQYIIDLIAQYPNYPSRTLAVLAYDKEPNLFNSVEHARGFVRYYREESGIRNRANKKISVDDIIQMHNPLRLPEGDEDDFEWLPYKLSDDCKRILCLYDVHVPYHDVRACNAAIQYGLDNKADTIFIGGDFMDCYGLSRYEKDPRKRGFKEELDMTRDFLKRLRELFPKARIYYMIGNHEERYQKLMMAKAPQLIGIQEFEIDILLHFGEYGIELIDDKRVAKIGRLNLIHGHELPGGAYSPVNPAKGLYNKAKRSTMCGHHHQTSEHTEKDISGDVVTCWSVGTLGALNPDYMPINKWNHGFAFIEMDGDEYHVTNKRIYNGRVL